MKIRFAALMLGLTVSIAVASSAHVSRAAVIVIPTANVSSSSEIPGFDRINDYLVDGSGLTGGQHSNVPDATMWLSTGSGFGGIDPDPSVTFDLGAVYTINSFHVWNYNEVNLPNRGVNSVSVEYGITAGLGSTVAGISSFAQATGLSTYAGEAFNAFTPFNAQFIKFDINTNHGDASTFYGLSEVQFDGVVPEPATATMLATFGLLGLVGFGRRWKR